MRCPACQQPITEDAASCPQCSFVFESLDRFLGIPPPVTSSVNDILRVLSRSERRRVLDEIERFEVRFPQLRMVVVTCNSPQGVPLTGYTYWLFNRNQAVSAMERGGANLMVMLCIDANQGKAACMIGYGLEPFLREEVLTEALGAAGANLDRREYAAAVAAFLSRISEQLKCISLEAESIYGLRGEWIQSADQLTATPRHAASRY